MKQKKKVPDGTFFFYFHHTITKNFTRNNAEMT